MLATISNDAVYDSAPQHNKLYAILEHDSPRPKTASGILPPTIVLSHVELPVSIDDASGTRDTRTAQINAECRHLVYRRQVIKELIDTEMAFTRDMRILLLVYKGTTDACPSLDTQTIQLIFRNIGDIVSVHTGFQSQLRKSVTNFYHPNHNQFPETKSYTSTNNISHLTSAEVSEAEDRATTVGHAFKIHIDSMGMAHEKFLEKSSQVIQHLAEIQQDPTVAYWLEQCKEVTKHLTQAWDLGSLLIKPVQRITRYPLIISKLLRYTPRDHPDRKDLLEARELLSILLFQINTNKQGSKTSPKTKTKVHEEPKTKPSAMRMLRKSMTKMRGWSDRLGGSRLPTDHPRNFSNPLDNRSESPDGSTMGDHNFFFQRQWSKSVPNLFRSPSI
ncbi:hypothetical protein ACHAPJ_009327 [Fusarium lateritium]